MSEERSERVALSGTTPKNPTASAPGPIDPRTGQHTDYWVLDPTERAKGFVRPLRRTYVHVGPPGPRHALRDLTRGERARHADQGYAKYESYPEAESLAGRFWTRAQLDAVEAVDGGCGSVTAMIKGIAETYARDPKFYAETFCCVCKDHFPVAEFVWIETKVLDDGAKLAGRRTDERVGS